MRKAVTNFFPKLIFSLLFVYVMILGIFNILVAFNKSSIEKKLADLLDAEKVSIGNISNLPLVFISFSHFSITVNEELSLNIEEVYFHYRFWKLFTSEFEALFYELAIDKIEFAGHNLVLEEYLFHLQKKFRDINISSISKKANKEIQEVSKSLDSEKFNFRVAIRQLSVDVTMMTEFHHTLILDNFYVNMKDGAVDWSGTLGVDSIWSNCVFLGSLDADIEGGVSNINNPEGDLVIWLNEFDLGGIPLYQENIGLKFSLSNQLVSFSFLNSTNESFFESGKQSFKFNIASNFKIAYNDYEEFKLLDYVFKPGDWNFQLNINQDKTFKINSSLTSIQYPDYGLHLTINPIKHNEYAAKLSLNTHYFGSVHADLVVPIRKGLYPLPSGIVDLEDVRFVLAGLVFSGNAVVDAIPGKNELEITGFNVKMNQGLIGNTAVRFQFLPSGQFNIFPKYLPNSALEVSASIDTNVFVKLKALDVDGDFVVKNIKLPVFGLKDSRYRGDILIEKKTRKDDIVVSANILGFLDGEEQIQADLLVEGTKIKIPHFYFVSQDILLHGNVDIITARSNTTINIRSIGQLGSNPELPIDVGVLIQKNNAFVQGLVDNKVTFQSDTKGEETDFAMQFDRYPLAKLGLGGCISGELLMGFDPLGWTRFAFQKGLWFVSSRKVILDFDSLGSAGTLNTSYMRLGLDRDVLDASGYFSISESGGIGGSFRFQRGGSLQFITGSYTLKANLDLRQFIIENPFELPIFDALFFLKNGIEEVEMDLALDLEGMFSNPNFTGNINLSSIGAGSRFRLVIPTIVKTNDIFAVTNVRLRHNLINLDSDMSLVTVDQGFNALVSGAIALGSTIRTKFNIDLKQLGSQTTVLYDIPNLYFFSKKPSQISGTVIRNENNYLFFSDHHKYGATGSFIYEPQQSFWNMTFLVDSLKVRSEGTLSNQNIAAVLNMDFLFGNMNFNGDIRKANGNMSLASLIEGSIDNPIVNGDITLKNISLKTTALRNEIAISNTHRIPISNNQILFDDIPIHALGGGVFGLNGSFEIQEKGLETIDLQFYSKSDINRDTAFLNWNLDVPYLAVKGKTFIDYINISGNAGGIQLNAKVKTENLNLGLELEDTIVAKSEDTAVNPFVALLSMMDMNIDLDLAQGTRLLSQLFDLHLQRNEAVIIKGSLGDNTIKISGELDISKGSIAYLGKTLKVDSGFLQFSGEEGDPFPYLSVSTSSTERSVQNETVEIYIDFKGKLPNIELANIASVPTKTRSELYGLLGFGGSTGSELSSAQDALASSVGIAENAFFTAPFTRRIQKLLPFLDTVQIRTDVLGNISRSLSAGNSINGFSVLHGSELEVGQYLSGVKGLQLKYNLRLESPDNSSLNANTSLNQIHKVGLQWSYPVPNFAQVGLGANIGGELNSQQISQTTPEVLFEGSIRKRF